MDWAQLSLRQPCGWEAGISALPGEAAAEGSRGTAGMASGDQVLLPTGSFLLRSLLCQRLFRSSQSGHHI